MWQEFVAPLIVIEFVSDTAGGEMDRTPYTGKFWVYEKAIRTAFYAVYTASKGLVEVYHLVEDSFHLVAPNQRRHFPIPQLGVELGIWFGEYKNLKLPWLRWWSADGVLLLTPEERAERLAAKLRELGINPDETGS
jgi:Uma2 family endonuclease